MSLADNITVDEDRGVHVVTFGEGFEQIDEETVSVAREVVDSLLKTHPHRLVLDLKRTTFFGSSFIEVLFRAWNQVKEEENGRFAIASLSSYCEEVLVVTNLNQLWSLYDDREAAVSALAGD